MRHLTAWFLIVPLAASVCGCNPFVRYASGLAQSGDKRNGITFYVGGAGPLGHTGSLDVPLGLRDAGYDGFVQVFTWQGLTHAGDQIRIDANRTRAYELATEIRRYAARHRGRDIHLVALSAGTGIATFALEYLPESVKVRNVVFLGCSMSSRYDLTRALRRVNGRMFVVYSPTDRILRDVVWYTGTVDRADASDGVAGLEGFRRPSLRRTDTDAQYRKLFNVAYRDEFAWTGYEGGHTDSTSRAFIRSYVAGALRDADERLLAPDQRQPTTAPTTERATADTGATQ